MRIHLYNRVFCSIDLPIPSWCELERSGNADIPPDTEKKKKSTQNKIIRAHEDIQKSAKK